MRAKPPTFPYSSSNTMLISPNPQPRRPPRFQKASNLTAGSDTRADGVFDNQITTLVIMLDELTKALGKYL